MPIDFCSCIGLFHKSMGMDLWIFHYRILFEAGAHRRYALRGEIWIRSVGGVSSACQAPNYPRHLLRFHDRASKLLTKDSENSAYTYLYLNGNFSFQYRISFVTELRNK